MKDSYTLKSLAVLLENNKISSKELTSEYLKNIENLVLYTTFLHFLNPHKTWQHSFRKY